MTHYLEIKLRPDEELLPQHLMSELFGRVHEALVAVQCKSVGLSFPEMAQENCFLGSRLRLHGTEEDLRKLLSAGLERLSPDYFALGNIREVPSAGVTYCTFRRRQSKSNPERLRRRAMKRHGLTEDEARQRIPNSMRLLNLPYVQLRSASTGERFLLFIEAGPELKKPVAGEFSCYGLSSTATVPCF